MEWQIADKQNDDALLKNRRGCEILIAEVPILSKHG